MSETRKDVVLAAVARGWCHKETEHNVMDVILEEAITEEVLALDAAEDGGLFFNWERPEETIIAIDQLQ